MNFLLRSMLFAPANNLAYMKKALSSYADAVVFDLEDAVPVGAKNEARKMLSTVLAGGMASAKTAFVRVNSPDGPDIPHDLAVGIHEDIAGFITPKITAADDLIFLDRMLGLIEREKGINPGRYKLIPLIENTKALMNIGAIVNCSPRILAVCFGSYDYSCDLRLMSSDRSLFYKFPKAVIAVAARSAGVQAIDTPYFSVRDLDGLCAEKREAFSLGFSGSLIVTPRHIDAVNECFSPPHEVIEFSNGVIGALESATHENLSAVVYDGMMIDSPVELLSRHIKAYTEKINEKGGGIIR